MRLVANAIMILWIVAVVQVTAYYPSATTCDDTPLVTAHGKHLQPSDAGRVIALSRDLAKQFRPGQRFLLRANNTHYVVEYWDLMNKRWRNRVDILLPNREECLQFGKRVGILIPIGD